MTQQQYTRDELAKQLAEERMEMAIEVATEGGIKQNYRIEEFMEDAYAFVDNCRFCKY